MKLVTFVHGAHTAPGLVLGHSVLDVAAAADRVGETTNLSSVLAIVQSGEEALSVLKRLELHRDDLLNITYPLTTVRLLAPIPNPVRNVFCVGRNYLDHVKEGFQAQHSDTKLPQAPQFFSKATRTVNAPQGDVRLDPQVTHLLDYEVELAVVIGKEGRDISKDEAFNYVFGYTIANDVTARDLQRRHDQWFKGKSLDTTLPLGPCIVTRDAIPDVAVLQLTMHINGEERQRSHASQMIFDIPSIIASLSAGLTLEAGDIICTGTPAGVGYAMTPPQPLRDGDVMAAAISGIGELRNRIVQV